MRLLYIASVYKPAYVYGGPARSIPSLCEGLAEVGAAVEVFTTNANRGQRLDVPLSRRVAVDGVPVTYFPVVSEHYFYAPALIETVRHQIHKFDVVEIDALFGSLLEPVAAICRKAGIPYLVPPHGQLLPGALLEKRWKKRFYLKLAGLRTLNAAAGIHCADLVEAESLAQAGVKAPAFVVPNSLQMKREPRVEPGLVRAEIGVPDSAPLLLFVGRFHRVKRLDIAVATLAALESAHLLLVGPDQEKVELSLRKQADLSGCAQRLHFLPLQSSEALRRIHAAADLFIMPSDRESFGMAAAEAMAAGLPVLVSDHVSIGRWAQAAQAGVMVSNQADEFREAARALLALPREELREMGARGRRCAASQFDRSVVARMFLERVGQVVNLRPIVNRPLAAEQPARRGPIANRPAG
jgi:glycosyltransferase involved in cell wall biosynthesis